MVEGKMSAHTPGPWRFNECDNCRDGGEIIAEPPYQTIRICEIPGWPVAAEEMRANARLIAAAPELYQAVVQAEQQLDYGQIDAALSILRAAIDRLAGMIRAPK